jgi:hypothetical protein
MYMDSAVNIHNTHMAAVAIIRGINAFRKIEVN